MTMIGTDILAGCLLETGLEWQNGAEGLSDAGYIDHLHDASLSIIPSHSIQSSPNLLKANEMGSLEIIIVDL